MSLLHRGQTLVLITSSLSCGGAERVMALLANAWAARGHRVSLITLDDGRSDHYSLDREVERVALDLLWPSRGAFESIRSNLVRLARIRRAVLERTPAVVVSFIEQTNLRVLAALIASHVPVIVSERIDPRRHDPGAAWKRLRRLLYPRAAAVVVQTERVRQGWALEFLAPEHVHVIPNPLRPLPKPRSGESNDRMILAMGRLNTQKGFDLLLKAFARSRLQQAGWRLTILGEGPERTRLEQLARELEVSNSVALPGVVHEPENYMRMGGIFVMSSRYEGFPNALLEAMGMGMAVVSFDCESGPSELIRHGVNGLLVPSEHIDSLSHALVDLATNPECRQSLGLAAMEVRHRYAVEAVLPHWEALIARVSHGLICDTERTLIN
jgi:GalNAc-alpha-(1->4)-GalNAc-alpha-(1->3)-diNAcBac-PP-undecaprenol alpha-1,4-N-acetyl-D-galactosaminyltransferase